MKIKVADLYDLSLGLNDLAGKELPISTSLKVEQNQKNVSEELVASDKVRQKIIESHKTKDLVESIHDIDDEGQKKIDELMKQDVELNLKTIDIKELGKISIKPRTLTFLKTILKQENAE